MWNLDRSRGLRVECSRARVHRNRRLESETIIVFGKGCKCTKTLGSIRTTGFRCMRGSRIFGIDLDGIFRRKKRVEMGRQKARKKGKLLGCPKLKRFKVFFSSNEVVSTWGRGAEEEDGIGMSQQMSGDLTGGASGDINNWNNSVFGHDSFLMVNCVKDERRMFAAHERKNEFAITFESRFQ